MNRNVNSSLSTMNLFLIPQFTDEDPNDDVPYKIVQDFDDEKIRVHKRNLIFAKKKEQFKIYITVMSKGLRLRFLDPPIYMNGAGDTNCPAANLQNHMLPDDFDASRIDDTTMLLLNPEPKDLGKRYTYRLRIVDENGKRRDFDPVIQNGNGAPFHEWPAYLVPLLGTIAFAGVAFFAAYAAGFLPR